MKQAFLNQSISFIMKYQSKYKEEDREKLLYGLEGIYLTLTKTIILFGISFLLGFAKDFLFCMILFNFVRYPAFGFHADSSSKCLVLSGTVFLGISYWLLHVTIPFWIKVITYSVIFITFLLFAPADTEKRPLKNKKKRQIRKLCSMIVVIVYGIMIFSFSNQVANYFLIAILIEAIFISPIPYWIFKHPYQNYKKFDLNRNV